MQVFQDNLIKLPPRVFMDVTSEDDPQTAELKHRTIKMFNDQKITHSNGAVVYFDDPTIGRIDDFVEKVIEEKQKESLYQQDPNSMRKRFRTGIMGEFAVVKALGLPEEVIELDIGNTHLFDHPDLLKAGYNIGVKSCSPDNYPLVPRNIRDPQIFTIMNYNERIGYIIGIGSVSYMHSYLNKYKDLCDSYVRSPYVKQRKTAFPGLFSLDKCTSIKDLEPYKIPERQPDIFYEPHYNSRTKPLPKAKQSPDILTNKDVYIGR